MIELMNMETLTEVTQNLTKLQIPSTLYVFYLHNRLKTFIAEGIHHAHLLIGGKSCCFELLSGNNLNVMN